MSADLDYADAQRWLEDNGYNHSGFEARTSASLDSNYVYVFEVYVRSGRAAALMTHRGTASNHIMSVCLLTEEDLTATEARRKTKRRRKKRSA